MQQMSMFGCETAYRSSQITKQTRRESNGLVNRDKKREMILEQLSYGPATAREIAEVLYRKKRVLTPARDETAPRLTEMTQEGIVEVCGKKKDSRTGRKAAVYRIVKESANVE